MFFLQGMMDITICIVNSLYSIIRDGTTREDNWVWTGSYNVTYWGTIANAQNVVTIQDHYVAHAYTNESEEMWGSNNNTPNPGNSKFFYNKTDNTEHQFDVDRIDIEVYFSPSDNTIILPQL